MRILILSGIFPPDIGGPATQLDALASDLARRGQAVCILTFGEPDRLPRSYALKKISRKWPYCIRLFLYIWAGLKLAIRSDVVYGQDLYTAGTTAWLAKKILSKPLVTRFVEDPIGLSGWKTHMRSWVQARILKDSDRVVVVSRYLKELAVSKGLPADKIDVIYNSVDFMGSPSAERSVLRKRLGGGIILLTIGRLTPWKGVDTLIKLMPGLVARYRDIRLVIVGDGAEGRKLYQLSQSLDLGRHVFFTGRLGRQEVIDYLAAADVFLLNTHHEGMSHTLLEAMKMGMPIITTNRGGNAETIKDGQTGMFAEYNNEQEWFKAVCSLLDDPVKASQLAAEARKDLQRFSWSVLVQKTLAVLRAGLTGI